MRFKTFETYFFRKLLRSKNMKDIPKQIAFYIIILQVIIDIFTVIQNKNGQDISLETAMKYGASSTEKIWGKYQCWRLLTPTFLHANILHISLSFFVQMSFCLAFNERWGHFKYVVGYLITGVYTSMVSSGMRYGLGSVGSSGAIFGVFGMYTYLIFPFFSQIGSDYKWYVIEIPVFNILGFIIMEFIPRANNYAHAGGFIAGFFLSGILFNEDLPESKKKIMKIISYIVLIGIPTYIIIKQYII